MPALRGHSVSDSVNFVAVGSDRPRPRRPETRKGDSWQANGGFSTVPSEFALTMANEIVDQGAVLAGTHQGLLVAEAQRANGNPT
jgi:hypothetical protein